MKKFLTEKLEEAILTRLRDSECKRSFRKLIESFGRQSIKKYTDE